MIEKFNMGNVIVEQTSVNGLTLNSVGFDRKGFLTRKELENAADLLLADKKYENFIVYFDGCCKYKINDKSN
jgi:hypothetical protein